MPIGSLTGHFFANVYLNELDKFIKHQLRARAYLRYVDDFVLLAYERETLQEWQAKISDFLQQHLHLKLHPRKLVLQRANQGIDFLGFIVHPITAWLANGAYVPCAGALPGSSIYCTQPLGGRSPTTCRHMETVTGQPRTHPANRRAQPRNATAHAHHAQQLLWDICPCRNLAAMRAPVPPRTGSTETVSCTQRHRLPPPASGPELAAKQALSK